LIRYSAIRLSRAALLCFPSRSKALINARKIAAHMPPNIATNMAASMCSLLTNSIPPRRSRSGRKRHLCDTGAEQNGQTYGPLFRRCMRKCSCDAKTKASLAQGTLSGRAPHAGLRDALTTFYPRSQVFRIVLSFASHTAPAIDQRMPNPETNNNRVLLSEACAKD
jgi:hypothetical protein